MGREFLASALAFAAGVLVMVLMSPEPGVQYQEVIVPDTVILEREPDTVRTFVDRVVYRQLTPTQIAVAPTGAVEIVAEFCEPSFVTVTETDTVYVEKFLMRSVTYDDGWFFDRGSLLLTGITNTGELKAFDYKTRADFSAVVSGSEVLVREGRWDWLQDLTEYAAVAGLTWAVTR